MTLDHKITTIQFGNGQFVHKYVYREVTHIGTQNKKYIELSELKGTIAEMRDKLNALICKNTDPLGDDVLGLSKELDKVIQRYTDLEMELKSKT